MIEILDLSVYKNNIPIFDGINLKIENGDKILITGKSGSGKTTLLKTILFFDVKSSGKIIFEGEEISRQSINDFRNSILYIGQKAPAFNGSVKDFLYVPFEFKNNTKKIPEEKTVKEFLSKLSFDEDILEKNFNSLSGGEQQRITIIQSLLLDKKIFLLDEITSSLDEENIQKVVNLFRDKEKTVLTVSHNREWKSFAGKSYELKNGKLKKLEIKNE